MAETMIREMEDENLKRDLDDLKALVRGIGTRHSQASPHMRELARRALAALEKRKGEDINEWAERLVEDIDFEND